MRIYVGHSKDINYVEELYKPIREFEKDTNHTFIFPHEENVNNNHDRYFYASFDLFVAEVSLPTTGLGIELGWAYDSNVPISCIYRKGQKISGSLRAVTDTFIEYGTIEELKSALEFIIGEKQKKLML